MSLQLKWLHFSPLKSVWKVHKMIEKPFFLDKAIWANPRIFSWQYLSDYIPKTMVYLLFCWISRVLFIYCICSDCNHCCHWDSYSKVRQLFPTSRASISLLFSFFDVIFLSVGFARKYQLCLGLVIFLLSVREVFTTTESVFTNHFDSWLL